MSTYLKRIGSIPIKFQIIIFLKQFSINISPNYVCKVSVILKRGKNKIELESPSTLINKQAEINQTLTLKTTLYYNKKQNIYQEKKATLDIILIFPNERKLAGVLKINLAHYSNYYMNTEVDEKKGLESCPDPTAKISFSIMLSQIISEINPNSFNISSEDSNSFIKSSKILSDDMIPSLKHSKLLNNEFKHETITPVNNSEAENISWNRFLSQNVSPKSEDINFKLNKSAFTDETFKINLKNFHNLIKDQPDESKLKEKKKEKEIVLLKEKIISCEEDLIKINEEKFIIAANKFKKKSDIHNASENLSPSFPTSFEDKQNLMIQSNELKNNLKHLELQLESKEKVIQEKDQKLLKLQSNFNELYETNTRITKELEKIHIEYSNLTKKINEHPNEMEDLTKRINDQLNAINTLKLEKNDFKKQNNILLEEYNKVQKEYQILNEKHMQLQADFISKKEKIKVLELELLDLKNKEILSKNSRDKEISWMKENELLNERINKLGEEKQSLLKENENIYNLLQNLHFNQNTLKELKETIYQHQNNENLLLLKQKEHSETIKKKDDIIRKYEENLQSFKEELETKSKEQEINQNLIRQLTKLKDNLSKDQEKIRNLEYQLAQYKDNEYIENDKFELLKQENLNAIQDYQVKNFSLKQEIDNIISNKNDLLRNNENLLKEKSNLLNQINFKDKKIEELQNQLNEVNSTKSMQSPKEINNKISMKEIRVQECFEKEKIDLIKNNDILLKEKNSLLFEKNQKITLLENELRELHSELNNKDQTIADLTNELIQMNTKKSIKSLKIQKETNTSNKNLEQYFEKEKQNYYNEISGLKEELQEKDKTIKKLTESFKFMSADRDNFKSLYNSVMEKQKFLEEQFLLNKIKLGKALNAAFEIGATDVVEVIENAILESDRISVQSNSSQIH